MDFGLFKSTLILTAALYSELKRGADFLRTNPDARYRFNKLLETKIKIASSKFPKTKDISKVLAEIRNRYNLGHKLAGFLKARARTSDIIQKKTKENLIDILERIKNKKPLLELRC